MYTYKHSDFILGDNSGFDFVNSQIQKGIAFPFTAKATAPTVTLPRIKALTTGTIPSFLDAILNIAESDTTSSLANHDNWVYQYKQQGNRSIYFFGDDTWIRLFPDLFTKTDGTTSFYVSDTVQVDLNVTRHIETDLRDGQWDAAILHYLGLDHIGHLGGPKSPLMKPKQKEMDEAIEAIYRIVQEQDALKRQQDPAAKGTLMVVCGDHGMNEKGNHGGSSVGETSAALVFLSPKFKPHTPRSALVDLDRKYIFGHPIVDQIDLVPTLASLFSFPVPKNNLGKIIPELYQTNRDLSDVLKGLKSNAFQLGQLLSKTLPEVSLVSESADPTSLLYLKAAQSHQRYLHAKEKNEKEGRQAIELYYKFIDIAQSHLANTASDYSLNLMLTGVFLICLSTLPFIYWVLSGATRSDEGWNVCKYFSVFALVIYAMSMFSSSFVEEEHKVWYYLTQTVLFLTIVQRMRLSRLHVTHLPIFGLCEMVFLRVATMWCHEGLSDKVFSLSEDIQWHSVALTLMASFAFCMKSAYSHTQKQSIDVNQTAYIIQTMIKITFVLIVAINSILVFVYKMRSVTDISAIPVIYRDLLDWELVKPLDQVQLGKLIYNYQGAAFFVLLGLFYVTQRASLMAIEESSENKSKATLELFLYSLHPLVVLLNGTQNAILLFIFTLQFQLLQTTLLTVPTWLISVIFTCLAHCGFFLTGHTNSLASVDLSHAYVGVQEYNPFVIGFLTFCSNWSGGIWWMVAGWVIMAEREDWFHHLVIQSTVFSLVLSCLSISVTVLREHLFIWTVFSPKYLYQISWTCLYHWLVQTVVGSILVQYVFKWNTGRSALEREDS
ncbi:GPI ethanolamine phosphate transferase 2 [Choanephora cucurbitarum]|uniref:GPI ethanolamine phosphate transferase 2 n=1 Tax=Choanephora cucurbitarum TaxID=101091 RepID=A0A1C7NA54_9FUNG|nr:GPI ethanolamine phosphate transferase 2 [Choanephora cucurbitarum]